MSLTQKQSKLFTEIIDLNWRMDLEDEDRSVLFPKLTEAISELKKDMGEDEYNEFIRRGREMFQPKK